MVYSSLLCIDSYQLSVQWNGRNTIEHACLPVFHEKMMRLRRQKRKRKIFKSAAECLCKREKRGNEREKGSKTIVCCLWFDGWGAILKIQNSNCQLFSFFKLTNCLFSFFCDPRSHTWIQKLAYVERVSYSFQRPKNKIIPNCHSTLQTIARWARILIDLPSKKGCTNIK